MNDDIVVVTEGNGTDNRDLHVGLGAAMDELSQPGAGSLEAGGSIGSSLRQTVEDESEQVTPIFRISE